jgi:hypothetical protein
MKMTRQDFRRLPWRKHWSNNPGVFDALVLMPSRRLHDSGYRCFDVIGVRAGKAVCRLAGASDVLHVDGIGGYGDYLLGQLPSSVPPRGWCIDWLPVSGLASVWLKGKIKVGPSLSSFEIFAVADV